MKLLLSLTLFLTTTFTAFAQESHQPYYVGEIGNRWEFPSDHLPRGVTIGNFHIAVWNMLNKTYLHYIEENAQGLKDSAITRNNFLISPDSSLTAREVQCAQLLVEMITHPTHPRSLIAVQETHKDMQNCIRSFLPCQWEIVTPIDQPYSQDLFLYDSSVFEFVNVSSKKYSENASKTIFTLTLKEHATGQTFRFVQSHIPGGPNLAVGCAKFAEEALRQYDPNMTVVLMGDMNASPRYVENALEQTAMRLGCIQPFSYVSISHPSHINTHREASWIDNFFVYSPSIILQGSHDPKELSRGLVASTVQLILEAKDEFRISTAE